MKVNESSDVLLEQAFDIDEPEVSISTVSSDVKISDSADGKCHITVYGEKEAGKDLAELVEISSSDKKLSLKVDRRNTGFRGLFSLGSPELMVVVLLPSSTVLKVKTVSGDIKVESGVHSIDAGNVSGDISILQNPAKSGDVKTVSGDISTKAFSSCKYALKSVSGDIKVMVAPGLEVDVDGKTVSGDLASEISLNSGSDSEPGELELVTITTSTVSGDFTLARN